MGLRQVVVVVVVVGAVVVGSGAAARLADSASRSFRYNLVVHTFFSPFNLFLVFQISKQIKKYTVVKRKRL